MTPEAKSDLWLSLRAFLIVNSVTVAIFFLIMAGAYYGP